MERVLMERSEWMRDRTTSRYRAGMEEFMVLAERTKKRIGEEDYILCPCKDCTNTVSIAIDLVELHLYKRGFMGGYTIWTKHGEEPVVDEGNNMHVGEVPNPDQSRMGVAFNLGAETSSYRQKTGMPKKPKKN